MILTPRTFQRRAAEFILSHRGSALFLDPGLGKTASTLLAINGLFRFAKLKRVLIVAPLRVVYSVWPREVEQWSQFRKLRCSIVHGTAKQRIAALQADAEIYLINPEGIAWLAEQDLPEFDMLVVDESTKFKSPRRKTKGGKPTRWRALQSMLGMFDRRVILTGTPCTNTLEDLWSQIFICDRGERLEKNISKFRTRYFNHSRENNHSVFTPKVGSKELIEAKISDIVLRMGKDEYLDLPAMTEVQRWVKLPKSVMKSYRRFERELFFELKDIAELAKNGGAKYLACRQIANGGLYVGEDEARHGETVHDAKIEAIADLHEELNGKPLMVIFHFQHELDRLKQRFGDLPTIAGGVSAAETDRIVDRWNDGAIAMLLCQPQAMSHGLNMQRGGCHQAWLGLTDDLEIYLQTIARLHRNGQTQPTFIHHVLAEGTVDALIAERIKTKEANQQSLLAALRRYSSQGV